MRLKIQIEIEIVFTRYWLREMMNLFRDLFSTNRSTCIRNVKVKKIWFR